MTAEYSEEPQCASCLPVTSLLSWRPSVLGSRLPGGRVLLRCMDHVDRRNENGSTEVTLTDVVELPLADGDRIPASWAPQSLSVEQPIEHTDPFAGHLVALMRCGARTKDVEAASRLALPSCISA